MLMGVLVRLGLSNAEGVRWMRPGDAAPSLSWPLNPAVAKLKSGLVKSLRIRRKA